MRLINAIVALSTACIGDDVPLPELAVHPIFMRELQSELSLANRALARPLGSHQATVAGILVTEDAAVQARHAEPPS